MGIPVAVARFSRVFNFTPANASGLDLNQEIGKRKSVVVSHSGFF